jgi:hypothetical protein
MDTNGNAITVWEEFVWEELAPGEFTAHWRTRVNRFSAASGTWGTTQLIDTSDSGGSAFSPQIAFDASGNAVAVWSSYDGTESSIRSSRFSAATGTWGIAGLVETSAGYASSPQIAVAAGGNAVAVWSQYDATRSNIWANRFQR